MHRSPTSANRPRTMPELCPRHQIGSTPESLRILHLYTQERIASDSSAFSEPKQVSCLGPRGKIIRKFLLPALHVVLRYTLLQLAKLTAGFEIFKFSLAHDAISFPEDYLLFPQFHLHQLASLSENHLDQPTTAKFAFHDVASCTSRRCRHLQQ